MRWHNPSSDWRILWKLITMTVNDITNQARLDLVFWLLAVAGQGDGWPKYTTSFYSKVCIKSSLTCFSILKVKKNKTKKHNWKTKSMFMVLIFFSGGQNYELSLSQWIQAQSPTSIERELLQLRTWENPTFFSCNNCSNGYPAI